MKIFPRSRSGFTLVEIILVVLIISILAVAGFSSLINFSESATAKSIRSQIVNLMNRARSYALTGKEIDWKNCSSEGVGAEEGAGSGQAESQKIVPEFFGVKMNLESETESLDLFARQKKCTPQDFIIESVPLEGSSANFDLKIYRDGNDSDKNETFLYNVPFGNFSMENAPTNKKMEIRIYNASGEKINFLNLNANVGIPE